MSSSPPRHHEVTRPVPQQFNPAAGNAPLAALLSALSSVAQASTSEPAPIGQGTNDAHFTARLCSALSLRPDSLLSNFQRQKVVQNASASSARAGPGEFRMPALQAQAQHLLKTEDGAADHSSAVACNSRENIVQKTANTTTGDQTCLEQTDQEQETSSNENNTSSLRLDKAKQEPMSEEAKKRRRQEINRESARRVRKRKSMEHANLQQQVTQLQTAAASAAADQAVIVRYATELTRERDGLIQRSAELETKWITAECRNVVLRQRIADLMGVTLQEVSQDTGQLMTHSAPAQHEDKEG